MSWEAVNDKIVFKIKEIPQSKVFSNSDTGNLREGEVLSVGKDVKEVKKGVNILLPFQDITYLEGGLGVCSERNVISVDESPIHYKLEVKILPKENEFDKLIKGIIVKTPLNSNTDFKEGDIIKFKDRTFMMKNNEIALLPEDKVFLKNN